MARACITNVNDWGKQLLEKLLAEGRIKRYWHVGGTPDYCFEFDGRIEINLSDLLSAAPDYVSRNKASFDLARSVFKNNIVLKIINTLQGGVVHGFTDSHIEVESTEKTELICFRVTPSEKKKLEKEAGEQSLTISDYIRKKVLPQC